MGVSSAHSVMMARIMALCSAAERDNGEDVLLEQAGSSDTPGLGSTIIL